ncbi:hypothetical protein PRZ48_006399 [Zasmidium cellare]|uniref:DNA 3'-5' helicase n=1 Tax=Zasmidium cellare TaxID=395010 RepID=A0ABR0ENC3_ZASCE|nr:hypothetical protein PRZ48_006399 [Zasmidium cellare]
MEDDGIFSRIDELAAGQQRQAYHNHQHDSSAGYSAYDGYPQYNTYDNAYPGDYALQDEYVQEPLQLDEWDQRLLHQPDLDSRHGQAALGRARLSLPPARAAAPQPHDLYQPPALNLPRPPPQQPNLSRFAFDSGQTVQLTSPSNRLSSPTFRLSQQHPAPVSRLPEPTFNHAPASRRPQPTQSQPQLIHEEPTSDEQDLTINPLESQPTSRPYQAPRASHLPKTVTPIVQGINLVSTHELPDRFRAMFPFPLFNAVQSKCFSVVYQTNDNFVVSAPTGSGKTAILELAICRLINGFANGSFKVVYQAPTKSLCAERKKDWQAKFGPLDLQVAELTGDTDNAQLRSVQQASIIVTTPEKWDSITRKWKDHQKLMQTVKLFLIDEVHILKEDRGATLEAVVSRMKSVGSNVRFVALSATVPNSHDIATWLGKDPVTEQVPAPREKFGEEFRPVRLQKHVCGYHSNSNDFAFEKILNSKLTDVITKWSQRKPLMVFCATRKACAETAKLLANWWSTKGPRDRYWPAPRQRVVVGDQQLRETVTAGVAFHHAGLSLDDRSAIEAAYKNGDINVICCTSTLAVGVNLPCHMVILKNTVSYQGNGMKEYSDLEVMQMLGRAGRPQFDNSAVAVIMTRLDRVKTYEQMIAGQEILESCLHKNLVEHLNSEIGLGTVTNLSTAKKWLKGTFLYVRLKENPEHYHIEDQASGRDLDERLENICRNGIASLEEYDLVQGTTKLQCTEFGDVMARYYLKFDTMKDLLAMPEQAKLSEIVSTVAQAAEFKDIRFRAGEKPIYKELNKHGSIRFQIPGNIDSTAHKVSLIIQSTLGAIELPTEESKHQIEYASAKSTIFQHAHRLICCIIDCQLYLKDATSARNALMLARSLGSGTWDDAPLHMMQLPDLGIVRTRKLAAANFRSIEDIESGDPRRIEMVLSRNPPYGDQLREQAKAFPRLRISLKTLDRPVIKGDEGVTVKVKAEIGFLNEKPPETLRGKIVFVCLLVETSDGRLAFFARVSGKKLGKGQELLFTADLTSHTQMIRGYVMCDEFAGTQRSAILKPEVPAVMFPTRKAAEEAAKKQTANINAPNTAKRRAAATVAATAANPARQDEDEFGDAGIDDDALVAAEGNGFTSIDDFDDNGTQKRKSTAKTSTTSKPAPSTTERFEPQQLANGKWACNHKCTDKTNCKHMCCREGLDRPPKPPKPKEPKKEVSDPKQTKLDASMKSKKSAATKSDDAALPASTAPARKKSGPKEARDLDRIHNSVQSTAPNVPLLKDRPRAKDKSATQPRMNSIGSVPKDNSSDYGLDSLDDDDLPADFGFGLGDTQPATRMSPPQDTFNSNDDDDDLLDDLYDFANDVPANEPPGPKNGIQDTPVVAARAGHEDRPIFITGDTSSSSRHNTPWQAPSTKREHDDVDESTLLPPFKKRKEEEDNEMLLSDSYQPSENDMVMQDALPSVEADVNDEKMEAEIKEEDKPEDVRLKEWFEKEFGTEMFTFVD